MTDISGELAKRITRRQFLFGGRNSGGGGSEAGVLGTVLGAAGIGVGIMALGSPGPNASSFTDKYATIASLNRRLNVKLVEEFLGGSNEDGEIGENGWTVELSGGTAAVIDTTNAQHPGIKSLTSGFVSPNMATIRLGQNNLDQADNHDVTMIMRTTTSVLTSLIFRGGIAADIRDGQTINSMMFEFDPDLGDTNWMAVTSDDYSVSNTRTDTGIAVVQNTWHVFRLKRSGSSVEFYIDDVLVATNTETLPTGFGEIAFTTANRVNGIKILQVDYMEYLVTVSR